MIKNVFCVAKTLRGGQKPLAKSFFSVPVKKWTHYLKKTSSCPASIFFTPKFSPSLWLYWVMAETSYLHQFFFFHRCSENQKSKTEKLAEAKKTWEEIS
ncbi:hypothetical protein [Desulfobotulus mexicanus]|uniref:Uncharacterized protein n=1 Tax=Desulfobotulus mexicanus TaxID=2586642 RepID=A0A5S5ME96_9BACT|nr:hypothetical protein [Desulfobotulus mexicanus]TYT74017.1 hypothetical protein FIM25_12070 [Desulfobotulus mexicanus]